LITANARYANDPMEPDGMAAGYRYSS